MKKSILVIVAVIEFFTLKVWFACESFTDIFHFSSINLTYQLEIYINPFKGTPIWFVRLFHNKFIEIFIDFLRFYLQFWDVRFGSIWFSLIGYFGILAGLYYIVSNKRKTMYHWVVLFILMILPCIEIIFAPSLSIPLKSLYLWLPFILFSLYGIFQFLAHGKGRKRLVIILILLLLSFVSIFFISSEFSRYCNLFPLVIKK